MGIYVIGAVLGVVFDDEDRHLVPVFAVAGGFDDLRDRHIVASHAGGGRELRRVSSPACDFRQAT